MSKRFPAASLSVGLNPLVTPYAPTGVVAYPANASASVAFTAPTRQGGTPITNYVITSSPGNFTGTGVISPVTVSGLTNDTSYTFTVTAVNTFGPSESSGASASVSPTAVFGLFGGGNFSNVIDRIALSTTGNATDFGDLLETVNYSASCSSSTRGVWAGGANPSYTSTMCYVSITVPANAVDFGDLSNETQQFSAVSTARVGCFRRGIYSAAP